MKKMSYYQKDTFGDTDAAISLVEHLNSCSDRNARQAIGSFVRRFLTVVSVIRELDEQQEYLLSLVRKDFKERLVECYWPYKLKERVHSVINTETNLLLKKADAVRRHKLHKKMKAQGQ